MSVNQKIHQLKLNEWAAHFSEQKASGLSARQWCAQNGFSLYAYNYWKHLLKEELAEQVLPDIVPLSLPTISSEAVPTLPVQSLDTEHRANCANRATARLTIGDASIEVDDQVSETFLLLLIKAVRHA
jgi:hypothetical protein